MESIATLIVSIITAIGGWEAIRYLINRKSEKRKSDAEAAKEVQDVYQQMVSDVKNDRNEQRAYINELKEDRAQLREEREELRQRIDKTEEQVRNLQREVARNGRMVESLRPFVCAAIGCRNRQPVTISAGGELEADIDPIKNDEL